MTEEKKKKDEAVGTETPGTLPVPEERPEPPAALEEELAAMKDRLLRMAAETENTRKRLEREKAEAIAYANERLIRELLPAVDNLERAIAHGEAEGAPEGLLAGLRMTLKAFLDALGRNGCVPFESLGKPFDPNLHEAVLRRESAEHPENTVIEEFERGYTLNDRLARPARVVVSKAPEGHRHGGKSPKGRKIDVKTE